MENRYDKYKDSGIAWIGEIPEHWILKRIKNICDNLDYLREPISAEHRSRNNPIYDYYGASGVIDKIDYYNVDDEVLLIGEDGANLVMRNLPLVYKAKGKFWVNNHAHILKPRNNNYDFCAYTFEAADYSLFITGSAQPKLSQENLGRIKIAIPLLSEQQSIATYLDQKCGEVDKLITLQEEIITKLQSYKQSVITEAVTKGLDKNVPLKDSGIEWIGEIPEHWEASKTLFSLSMPITDGPHTTPGLFETGIPFVSAEAVSFGNGRIDFSRIRGYISENFYQECCKKYVPQVDDIYMIKSGATTGRVAIVDTDVKFTIWSPLAVFRCNKERMLPRFLFYQLQSNGYQKQIELNWSYGTQQNIGMRTLEKLILSVPPLSEQQSIANYLDQKCSEIDELISIKQQKIEKLKDYKKSLIFECVTGKRKV